MGAHLTTLGELTTQHARTILAGVHRIERDANNHGLATLNVASFPSAVATLMAGPLSRLRDRQIDFQLLVTEPNEVAVRVRDLTVDVAIVSSEPGARLTLPEDFSSTPLLEDRFRVLMPSGHPLLQRSELDLANLLGERWITTTDDDDPEYLVLRRAFAEAGQEFRPALRVDDFDATRALVAADLGLAFLPDLAIDKAWSGVEARPLTGRRFGRLIHAAWRPDRPGSRELIDDIDRVAGLRRNKASPR